MRPKQSGSGLIEVLVAVVVLSVGLLSMLWAQTKSMGYQRTAEFRNMAAQIATEYADRMRANVAGADHYLSSYRYDPTQAFRAPIPVRNAIPLPRCAVPPKWPSRISTTCA